MEVPIDTSNMSEQELQFHYFKMHDADGNNKLDGCELVKSLIHWHGKDMHKRSRVPRGARPWPHEPFNVMMQHVAVSQRERAKWAA